MRDVCVVGLGLIGGAVLRAAAASGRKAWGATLDPSDAAAASAQGYTVAANVPDALRAAAASDALVVLAAPLPAVSDVLRLVAEHAPECLLTDVAGVKAPVLDEVRRIAPRARYAGGHPMAGTAESGWAAGHAELFAGATWVVCLEQDTDLLAWQEAARLAIDAAAVVCPVSTDEHDQAVARVSHLPHLLAEVLAAVGSRGGVLTASLAAGSFRDGTRVAGTRPELVRAMTEGNRDALLGVLDEALGMLGAARGSLASTGGLAATINAGHNGLVELAEHQSQKRAGLRVNLSAPEARDCLRALGAHGGTVTAFDGDTAIAETPSSTPT